MKLEPVAVVRAGILAALLGGFAACAASSNSGSAVRGSGGAANASGGTGSVSTGNQSSSSAGTVNLGNLDPGTGGGDAGHMTRCDSTGNNCTCISIASIGHEGVWGPCSMDNTTAFQNWLNTQSTAHVDNYEMKPALTADFLAKYDVIILQWMVANGKQNDDGAPWVFSADEVSALKDWVNKGGGIVALSGYQCEDPSCIQDITATNQLLSFTDIQFNRDVALTPKTVNQNDLYCWGGSIPLGAPISSDTYSTGTWDQTSPIGAHVTDVGAFDARTITSTAATVDVSDANGHYAVHEQIGQGHVVAYGDEWVTYSGEWTGTSACLGDGGVFGNMYDPCYKKSPASIFQISQFWYNSIKYAASTVQCFDIMAPGIVK